MNDDALKIKRSLAADLHSTEIDLANDQVWELNPTGDPPALALRTSYGLRCGGMRVFPQFSLQGITLTDPNTFAEPVRLLERQTNYLLLECKPFPQLDIQLEFWVPASQVLCGRFKLTNLAAAPINCAVDWAVILQPLGKGEPMSPAQMGINTVLQGRSNDLYPVFFVTGGPEALAKAHPALEVKMTLGTGASRRLSWALATLDSTEASFSLARQSTSLPWEVETVKSEMLARNSLVEISLEGKTYGDLFHEAQIKAQQLLLNAPAPSKRTNFLTRRQPDSRNYTPTSRRQELVSYSQVNAYDAWMLSRILLPGNAQVFKEIIRSFIDFQQDDGSIPWAVSAGGVASTALTPPLLAGIVCDVQPFLDDKLWLSQVYAPLLRAFKSWFSGQNEKLPVWDSPLQTGIENNPLFSLEPGIGLGMSPHTIKNPPLFALLYKECQALLKIAGWVEDYEDKAWLVEISEKLAVGLETCWDGEHSTYSYRDIETGLRYTPEVLHEFNRNGLFKLKRNLKPPRRLTLFVADIAGGSSTIKVKLTGKNGEADCAEELELRPRYTGLGGVQVVSSQLLTRLETVEVAGLKTKTTLTLGLSGNDSEDVSLLLPLWSGVLSKERQTELIEKTLIPRYLTGSGLATFPLDRVPEADATISPFWNYLLIEGLIQANQRDVAARVIENLIRAQMTQWQGSGFVSSAFRASDLRSIGELDSLAGLPTIWPLLRSVGIERMVNNEIILNGLNEFLPPITVQYKEACLTMNADQTLIQSVSGEQVEVIENTAYKIVLP